MGVLVALLAPETSSRFPDPFLLQHLDASRISWVLTANRIEFLQPHILDRVRVIQIQAPPPKYLPSILSSMHADLCGTWGLLSEDMPPLEGGDVERLSSMYGEGKGLRFIERRLETLMRERIWEPPKRGLH